MINETAQRLRNPRRFSKTFRGGVVYGCYFPTADITYFDDRPYGMRGKPINVEWLDTEPAAPSINAKTKFRLIAAVALTMLAIRILPSSAK